MSPDEARRLAVLAAAERFDRAFQQAGEALIKLGSEVASALNELSTLMEAYAEADLARSRPKPRRETKVCLECGEEFERPPETGSKQFRQRKYCSTACSGKARGRLLSARYAKQRAEAEPKTVRVAEPRNEPRPAPRPKPRPPLPRPDEKRSPRIPQAPIKARPQPAPAPQAAPRQPSAPVGEHRMEVLGEPCPHHPSEKINAFGKCPACVSGGSWAARQREVVLRPQPEGGR